MISAQGYADRLSEYDRKGTLNLAEEPDGALLLLHKARVLAARLKDARSAVVHTGAGISTSAGIPDFRGPAGVWTQQSRSRKRIRTQEAPTVSFEDAQPTVTHVAIAALQAAGHVHHVVSQNVDNLHVRSGLSRAALSELHGNLFVDWCHPCQAEWPRQTEAQSVGFSPTGRFCPTCAAALTDKALDWHDALPEPDYARAITVSRAADLHVVAGTSCQMEPARGLPFNGGLPKHARVLVNLSCTEFDHRFGMVVRGPCDSVFAVVVHMLGLRVPELCPIVMLAFEAARVGARIRCMTRVRWDGEWATRRVPGVKGIRYFACDGHCDEQKEEAQGDGAVHVVEDGEHSLVDSAGYEAWIDDEGDSVKVEVVIASPNLTMYKWRLVPVDSDDECRLELTMPSLRYETLVAQLVQQIEADARTEPLGEQVVGADAFVSGKRRGWVLCVLCTKEVWSGRGKREEHFETCLQKTKQGM